MSIKPIDEGGKGRERKKPQPKLSFEDLKTKRISANITEHSPGPLLEEPIKEKSWVQNNLSGLIKAKVGRVSTFFYKVLRKSDKICIAPNTFEITTDETCSLKNTESEGSEKGEDPHDLEERLIFLCKDLISIKLSRIPLEQGDGIENEIKKRERSNNPDEGVLQTLHELNDLHKQLLKYHRLIEHHLFSFEVKKEEIESEIKSWPKFTISEKNTVATLCDLVQASFILSRQKTTIEEIDSFVKQMENANYKDRQTLDILKKQIADKKKSGPNTAFDLVHLDFLKAKQDLLTIKMKKSKQAILDLLEKKANYHRLLRGAGVESPDDLFHKSWDQLSDILHNLPIDKKVPLFNRVFFINDFNLKKALKEFLTKGEITQKLNWDQTFQLMEEIKNYYN